MAAFTVCVAQDSERLPGRVLRQRQLRHWHGLGLPLLLFGEWEGSPAPGVALVPDLRTTRTDQPRLDDLLRLATARSNTASLVLLRADAMPAANWSDAVAELASRDTPVLAWGRAWCSGPAQVSVVLDPPSAPSWILLPRGAWSPPPHSADSLAADPAAALPWLLQLAAAEGWQALDATDAAHLDRLGGPQAQVGGAVPAQMGPQPRVHRLGTTPAQAPRLSLLLQGSAADQERWHGALGAEAELGWELLDATPAHWQRARGALIGSLDASAAPPPLALLAALVRAFRNPWIDGVELVGLPPLLRRAALERLGPAAFDAALCRASGLQLLSLPLLPLAPPTDQTDPNASAAPVSDPDPLWQAAAAQLERAEGLLLAQQRRIAELERELARLRGARSGEPEPQP